MKRISEILALGTRSFAPAAVAAVALLSSCSMFHDDLPECAVRPTTRATVNFIYDYNTSDADRFAESVGSVTLYVFDAQGQLVLRQEHTVDAHAINASGYSMPVDLPVGHYTLYASARENTAGYEASLLTEGAKFRRSGDEQGALQENILYTLDHTAGLVDHCGAPLEHFWLTREAVPFDMTEAPMPEEGAPQPDDVLLSVNVPLQRVTNNISLTVSRTLTTRAAADAPLSPADYDIKVVTINGASTMDLLGRPTTDASTLTYTPHMTAPGTTAKGRSCLTASISTSRIMHEEDASRHTQLVITSRKSGETFTWDLPALLANGRHAYGSKGWGEQEYLDRETDYEIAVDFNETDDSWRYIEVSISVLSWAKRIQNVAL